MLRANRDFPPGHVWHLSNRCHPKTSPLKFAPDRHRYRYRGGGRDVRTPTTKRSYAGDFSSETDTLMPDNAIPWENKAESTET